MNNKIFYIVAVVLLLLTFVTGSYASTFISGVIDQQAPDYQSEEFEDISEIIDNYKKLREQNQILEEKLALAKDDSQLLNEYHETIEDLQTEQALLQEKILRLTRKNRQLQLDSSEKVAYLTFDDGPSKNTEQILDILKDYNVPATFFVIGKDTPFGRKMYERIIDEGHALGNHTYSHDYESIYQSPEAFKDDFLRMEDFLDKTVGKRPKIMRFPGGSKSASALDVAGYDVIDKIIDDLQADGYQYFDWNVTSGDASSPSPSKEEIAENVLEGSHNKTEAVVLFHDSSSQEETVKALPEIIEGLRDMGYSFDILTKDGPLEQFTR